MPKKNKSVIPAVVIGLAATVAGFSVALRSLHNISLVEKFKDKLTCSTKPSPWEESNNAERKEQDSWDNPAPHALLKAGSGNKKVIPLDLMNGLGSLDSLPGYKVFNLHVQEPTLLDPLIFTEDNSEKSELNETIAFLDTVSGDELNGEELPTKEKKLGKRSAEGYPAAYEAEEVSDYLEQEFGITSPKINPKGDISAAIQAHDHIEQSTAGVEDEPSEVKPFSDEELSSLWEKANKIPVSVEVATQDEKDLPAAKPKAKKKSSKTTELMWKDFAEFKEKYGSLIQDAFDVSKEDKNFVLKVSGKTHGIGARGTAGKTKAGKEFKSFDAKDIAAIHKKINT